MMTDEEACHCKTCGLETDEDELMENAKLYGEFICDECFEAYENEAASAPCDL